MSETTSNVAIARRIVQFLLAVGILAAGIVIAVALVKTRPEPEKVARENPGELVEVIEVHPSTQSVVVSASGTVVPAQQIALAPEVGGRVSWMSDKLIPGGRFAKGDQIVRIDPRDYRLAVEQQVAQVDRARTELEIERSRKQIAEREWKLLGGKQQPAPEAEAEAEEQEQEQGGSLALRDPQLRTAQAAVKAAQSGLDRAKLAVAKTVLRAPFNAMVQSKSVDVGQLVGPQTPLANLVGTDAFWVQVSIPVERLGWLQIPGVGATTEGSPARIVQKLGSDTSVRQGKVVRLLGDLDPQGRMARVLVEIDDPLGLAAAADPGEADGQQAASGLPLLLGSYVTVEISGKELPDIIELPRVALHDGDKVYVMTPESTLAIKQIQALWRRPDTVLVSSGLADGDKVVTSPIAAPVEGMKLRTKSAAKTASADIHDDGDAGGKDGSAQPSQRNPQGGGANNAPALAKPSR